MAELDFSKMHEDLRRLVGIAMDVGWTARSQRGGIRLRAPGDVNKNLDVPRIRQVKHDTLRGWYRTVLRYGDEEKVAGMMAGSLDGALALERDDPAAEQEAFAAAVLTNPNMLSTVVGLPVQETERYVVSQRPWLARKATTEAGAQQYESEAVVERTWSDRTVDYLCSRCEYTADRPRSVSSHYGGTHSRDGDRALQGPVVAVDPTLTEPTGTREYHPTERLIRLLAHFLEEALQNTPDSETWEGIARAALTWAHERPDLAGLEHVPTEPLTDEQIVARIRVLVGSDEVPRLREEIDDLAARLSDAEDRAGLASQSADRFATERDEALDRVARMQADLDAVEDMLATIRGGGS